MSEDSLVQAPGNPLLGLGFLKYFYGLTGECNLVRNFLDKKEDKSIYIFLKILDALLRGISQVVFANNPISGLLILVGLFTLCSSDDWRDGEWECQGGCLAGKCTGDWEWVGGDGQCRERWMWEVGVAVVLCSLVAIATATAYRQPRPLVQNGITQFNAVLVGCVVMSLYPLLYNGSLDIRTWVFVIAGAALSVIVQAALGNWFNSIQAPFEIHQDGEKKTQTFGLPSLTFPFNIVCCVIMGVLVRTIKNIDQNPEDDISSVSNISTSCSFTETKIPTSDVEWDRVVVGAVLSMGEVYAVDSLRGSIIMYIGVAVCSPLLAVVEFVGALIGSMVALVVSPPPYDLVYSGVWGYCPLLTAGALGGFFVVLTPSSIPATVLAIASTAAVQSFLVPVLQVAKIPVFTLPFVLTTWIFLLLNTQNQTFLRVPVISTPEAHLVAWNKENKSNFSTLPKYCRSEHGDDVRTDFSGEVQNGVY